MIYFITEKGMETVKIGFTEDLKTFKKRRSIIQCGNSKEIILLKLIEGDKSKEFKLHFKYKQQHIRGEWFSLTDQIKKYINGCKGIKTRKTVPKKRKSFLFYEEEGVRTCFIPKIDDKDKKPPPYQSVVNNHITTHYLKYGFYTRSFFKTDPSLKNIAHSTYIKYSNMYFKGFSHHLIYRANQKPIKIWGDASIAESYLIERGLLCEVD